VTKQQDSKITNTNSSLHLTMHITEDFGTNQTEKQDFLSTIWIKDEKI